MPSFVEISPPVTEKKFLKGFYNIWDGDHLGHMTWIIYAHIGSPFISMFHVKHLAFIGQSVSEKKILEYYGNKHVNFPEVRANQPLGSKFFQNHQSSVHLPISFHLYKLHPSFIRTLQMKFGFDWPSGFRGDL